MLSVQRTDKLDKIIIFEGRKEGTLPTKLWNMYSFQKVIQMDLEFVHVVGSKSLKSEICVPFSPGNKKN